MSQRLSEIFVKTETRNKIRKIKGGLTYDQFLNQMIKGEQSSRKEKPATPTRSNPRTESK